MSSKFITDGSNNFILSSAIHVFPCAYRGINETTTASLDAKARLNTEQNFTNLYPKLTKDTYIINWDTTSNILYCMLGGYYFEINISESEISTNHYLYLQINDVGETGSVGKTILNLKTGTDRYLDFNDTTQSDYYFAGVSFVDSKPAEAIDKFILDLTSNSSKLPIIASKVESNLSGTTITGNLVNGTASGSIAQLNNATTANTASAKNAIALGEGTTADKENLVVIGKYNTTATDDLFVIGNGNSTTAGNAIEVKTNKSLINVPINNISISGSSEDSSISIKNQIDSSSTAVEKISISATGKITSGIPVTFSSDTTSNTLTINAAATSEIITNGNLKLPANNTSSNSGFWRQTVDAQGAVTNTWIGYTTTTATANVLVCTNSSGKISLDVDGTATKAKQDENGNSIHGTYAKYNGVTFTAATSSSNNAKLTFTNGATTPASHEVTLGKVASAFESDNVTTNINGHAITNIFETDGTTIKNATNAANVTTNINSHPITDIFETNGTTVKNATTAANASYQTTAPTAAITDGGVHIVHLTSSTGVTERAGYIYMYDEE